LAFPIAIPAPESDATLTYGPLGTLPYMAPEQHRDAKQADARSDVWGLGATLYELLTLHRAFPRGESVLNAEPIPPCQLNAGLDRDLEAVVLKALRKDPAHRYPTAGDLAADLRRWLRFEPTKARPAHVVRRAALWARRNKGWAAAIAVAVAAMMILGVGGVEIGRVLARAAQAEAKQAGAAVLAAQARERAQIREAYLQQIERIRLTPHVDGWSHEVLDLSHKAFLIDKDNVGFLQSQAATTLAGLDAHKVKSFPFTASALAFDAAGKLLMATPEGKIRVWDATTVQTEDLASPGDGVFAFRPNGTPLQLVIAKDRRSLVLWDVAASRALRTIPIPVEGRSTIVDYALTSDGARVGACIRTLDDQDKHRDEGTVAVWDGGSGRLLKTFPLHRLTKVALSSGGKLLAAGDEDGRITICDVAGEEPIGSFRTGRVPIRCLTFSPGSYRQLRIGGKSAGRASDLLAVGDVAGGLSIWDTYNRIPISYCRGSYYEVIAVAFSPDGSTLASCGRSTPKLWDLATGRRLLDLEGASYLLAIAFAPDGRSLAVSKDSAFGGKAQVDVWKIEDGRGIQTLRGLSFPAEKVVFSPDGKRVAALSHSWQVGIWDRDQGRLLRLMDVPPGSFTDSAGMAFSPDNRRFAFAAGNEATLWDLETNAVLGSWTLPEGLGDWLVFRGSHQLMLVRCENKDGVGGPFSDFPWRKYPRVSVIRDLLGSDPSRRLAVLTDINIYVNCSDVSPDGTYYVVEGLSGTPEKKVRSIHLYEVATGKRVWTIPSQQPADDLAGGVGFDPTGTVLAVRLSRGRPVTLLNVPSGDVLDTISPGSPVLGPRAEKQLWLDVLPPTPERPEGLSLFQRAVKEPLVTFLLDGNGSSSVRFTRDGLHAAWGRTDGTVTVANFVDVQRRLAEIGLSW
ncbi:MAG TPA: hypothetical protein VJY33_06035, partial [Isosphaeraceae bacterium]|nr:hypothetical protein [Isosphaeraceae bacterium]